MNDLSCLNVSFLRPAGPFWVNCAELGLVMSALCLRQIYFAPFGAILFFCHIFLCLSYLSVLYIYLQGYFVIFSKYFRFKIHKLNFYFFFSKFVFILRLSLPFLRPFAAVLCQFGFVRHQLRLLGWNDAGTAAINVRHGMGAETEVELGAELRQLIKTF